jgi:hypothetical protein
MSARSRFMGLISATAVALVATATAAQAMTVSLGAPTLLGRVSVNEPLSVSCSAFDPSLTLFSEGAFAQVEQAAGTKIARGSGSVSSGFLTDFLFPCDGTQNTVNVTISADPAGPPFHCGPAVFTASALAQAGTPCFPGSTSCFTNITSQSATAGPTQLNLH